MHFNFSSICEKIIKLRRSILIYSNFNFAFTTTNELRFIRKVLSIPICTKCSISKLNGRGRTTISCNSLTDNSQFFLFLNFHSVMNINLRHDVLIDVATTYSNKTTYKSRLNEKVKLTHE